MFRRRILLTRAAPRLRAVNPGVLSRGRGRTLAYRSAPHHLGSLATDAADQRLARNPLPRATPGFVVALYSLR